MKQENNLFWKGILILTFVLSLLCFLILVSRNLPKYEYEVIIIELENSNFGEEMQVVDYICDEGIKVTNIQSWISGTHWFYASTWIDANVHSGKCAIKVRKN
jgi:hypothetical protein